MFAVIPANKTSFLIRLYPCVITVHTGIFPLTVYVRTNVTFFIAASYTIKSNFMPPTLPFCVSELKFSIIRVSLPLSFFF